LRWTTCHSSQLQTKKTIRAQSRGPIRAGPRKALDKIGHAQQRLAFVFVFFSASF